MSPPDSSLPESLRSEVATFHDAGPCLTISAFLITWLSLAAQSFNPLAALVLLLLPWVLLRTGAAVSASMRFLSSFTLDFLLGVAVVSAGIMAWKIVVPLSLWFALVLILVASAFAPKILPSSLLRERVSGPEFLAICVSLVAATGWSHELLLGPRMQGDRILFPLWADFFTHASMVARLLGDRTLTQVGNYELKGFPAIAYHYASYSLPVLLAKSSGASAYSVTAGFWVPFGSFLAGLGSYTLGRGLWGRGSGLAAAVAVMVLPDGALLGLIHPYYGYFWLQHIAAAALYAVALSAAALVLIFRGIRAQRRLWIVGGLVIGALTALFKLHIFAAAFPLCFSFAVIGWPPRKPGHVLILAACIAGALGLLTVINYFHLGPGIRLNGSGAVWYWRLLAETAAGTNVGHLYQVFRLPEPFPRFFPRAVFLLFINALGVFAVAAPLAWFLILRKKTWELADAAAPAAIFILMVMTFGLSRNNSFGTQDELLHRPFVWAYFLVASLTTARLASLTGSRIPWWFRRILIPVLMLLALIPAWFGSGLQRGKIPVLQHVGSVEVDRGMVESARFLQRQTARNAVVQDSRHDEFLLLGSIGEHPSFAARPALWEAWSKTTSQSGYQKQLQQLARLEAASTPTNLHAEAQATGIRWYVLHPEDSSPWPSQFLDRPAFESNGYRVYDLQNAERPPE